MDFRGRAVLRTGISSTLPSWRDLHSPTAIAPPRNLTMCASRVQPEPMLNSSEAGKFCRVTKEQVLRWARRGLVPSYRIRGTQKRLFKASDLAKMIRPVEPKTPTDV